MAANGQGKLFGVSPGLEVAVSPKDAEVTAAPAEPLPDEPTTQQRLEDTVSLHHSRKACEDDSADERPSGLCITQWRDMFSTSQLIGMVLGIGLYLVFLPLELDEAYPRANDMLAVTALVASFWAFEVLPLEFTALLPMVLIPFAEVETSAKVAASYWNWIQMMFLGAFIVDIGIKQVGLHRRFALKVLLAVGVGRAWIIMAAFMFVAWAISMWCSNTATTVMLIPYATFLLDTACSGSSGCPANLNFQKGVFLAIAYSATAGGVATNIGTAPNGVLLGQPILDGQVSATEWISFALPVSFLLVCIVFVVMYFFFARGVNLQLDESWLRQEYVSLGVMDRDEIVVLVVQILQVVGWVIRPEVINGVLGIEAINDGAIACAAAVWLFFIPSCRRRGQAILGWKVTQDGLPWGVFLLMGGGFALAKGFETSELTIWIGQQLVAVASVNHLALTYLIVLCVCFTTEVTSNTATASIILPVLASVSLEALVHPLALMLPAACACSFAFMLPAATPPNLVVFATNRVTMRDFVVPGLVINVIAVITCAPLIYLMALAVFDVDGPFPKYACDASEGCAWVAGQACLTSVAAQGLCRIEDGTLLSVVTGLSA